MGSVRKTQANFFKDNMKNNLKRKVFDCSIRMSFPRSHVEQKDLMLTETSENKLTVAIKRSWNGAQRQSDKSMDTTTNKNCCCHGKITSLKWNWARHFAKTIDERLNKKIMNWIPPETRTRDRQRWTNGMKKLEGKAHPAVDRNDPNRLKKKKILRKTCLPKGQKCFFPKIPRHLCGQREVIEI